MKRKVTIAIPVYNGEKYILKALQSIVRQTYKVDKLLICDNKSNDNTIKIVKSFAKANSALEISLHINPNNIGTLPNFNKCLELCNSKYLLLLAVDDRLKHDAIEKLMGFYKQHPDFGVVAGKVDIIDENERVRFKSSHSHTIIFNKGQILELVEKTNLWIHPSAALYNMEYTRKIGFWDETNIGGDERYWAQILQQFPLAIIADSVTYQMVRRDQTGNLEHLRFKDKIMHFKSNLQVADFETDPQRRNKARKLLKKWAANQCIGVGRSVWKNYRKYGLALRYWIYGIKENPYILFKYRFFKTIAITIFKK